MREIKFRAWDDYHKVMINPYCELRNGAFWGEDTTNNPIYVKHEHVMQFVGLHDKNGKEIYESDIFRIEESTDEEDMIFYVVIVWIQEWCMFATLRVEDEYQAYLASGVKALDEPMFWTYTLEDTNSRKHFLCGNIYENPELLK